MENIQSDGVWKDKPLSINITYSKISSSIDAESESTPFTERQWDIAN